MAEYECDVPFLFNGVVHFHRLIVAPDLHSRGALLIGSDFTTSCESVTIWGRTISLSKGENFRSRNHERRSINLRTRGVHRVSKTRNKFEDRYKGPLRIIIHLSGLANAVIVPFFAANPSTIMENVVHTDRLKAFVSNGDAFSGGPPPRQEMPAPEEDTDEDPGPTDAVETSELPERSDKYALRARPSFGWFFP